MTKRKFYRRVFYIEVLSENSIPEDMELKQIVEECETGAWSGQLHCDDEEEVDGPTMANYLSNQGSDPGFFGLTEGGEDTEDV